MKAKDKLSFLAMAAMMSATARYDDPMYDIHNTQRPTIHLQKDPPPPKGTKEYWFNEDGEFSTSHMRKDEVVFKCVAINDKNATKKYEKWKKELGVQV